MSIVQQHILLFDKDCPLCVWYTNKLVRYQFISPEVRQAYQDVDWTSFPEINPQKASNQIALFDINQRNVTYGVDALLIILANQFPALVTIGRVAWILSILTLLYSFISYNRKICIPVNCMHAGSCNPSKHYLARFALVALTIFISSSISYVCLSPYIQYSWIFPIALVSLQWACSQFIAPLNQYDYIGHLSVIVMQMFLILGICTICNHYTVVNVLISVIISIGLHVRRVHKTGASQKLSIAYTLILITSLICLQQTGIN